MKMKSFYIIFACTITIFLHSCGSSTSDPKISKKADDPAPALSSNTNDGQISKDRFASMLNSVTNPQLVDVRTPDEFKAGRIAGAKNFDFFNDGFSDQIKTLDKTQPVFVYCKSGGRSGKTYKMLKDMGMEKVYDLREGYEGWK